MDGFRIQIASSQQEFNDAIELFKEYANAINFDAGFKNFAEELASLDKYYSSPNGCLLLVYQNNKAIGCVAVREMQREVAELKRFYVKPDFRHFKIGVKLLESAIANAKRLHFDYLRLEVIPTLKKAKELYCSFGFYAIEPYQPVALEGTVYMEKELMNEAQNPWKDVPLADYEKHMSHTTVGQLKLLSLLTKKYFQQLQPESAIILGVAGGNGLEHVNPLITKQIIGIDINQNYLDVTFSRYSHMLNGLELLKLDITKNIASISSVNLIWAALIIEYVGIENALFFAQNNLVTGGHLIVTIQSNRHLVSVSPTGVESVKKVGQIFQSVDIDLLVDKAEQLRFRLVDREENELPNGKSFQTFHFIVK